MLKIVKPKKKCKRCHGKGTVERWDRPGKIVCTCRLRKA